MKLYIFHGENVVESRRKLVEWLENAQVKGWQKVELSGKELSRNQLLDTIRSQGLFSTKKLIVIENFLSGNKKGVEIAKGLVQQIHNDTVLIFWEGKSLDGRKIKSLAKYYTIQAFKLPRSLFIFLDSLKPENTQNLLKLLQETREKVEPELLFYMLGKQIRFLIWAKAQAKTLNLAPWQKGKLLKQAETFTLEHLRKLHSELLEIDRLQKKSRLPEDLSASLDLLVASI